MIIYILIVLIFKKVNMKILFVHKSFPGQFKFLVSALTLDHNNVVMFITEDAETEIKGVNKLVYDASKQINENYNPYSLNYDLAINQGIHVAAKAMALKERGIIPDVIMGFSGWGCSMFIKDVFPDVPFICYCEWYLNPEGGSLDFGGEKLSIDAKAKLRCDNAHVLTTLSLCDAGISPTNWQKQQFPKEYQNKIEVIPDGVDIDSFSPDENVKFKINGTDLELTKDDEVITYAARGLEPCRGYPEFMKAVAILQKKRPNAYFVIAGQNEYFYSYKKSDEDKSKEVLETMFDINMDKVYFVGKLPYKEYAKLLQVSTVHVYLTYPFVLSWSFLDAMSTGCCIVASDTAPVNEVMQDNYNGLLTDFFDVNKLADKIEYSLDNQNKMNEIRENARKTIIQKYDLVDTVARQIKFIDEVINKFRTSS